jgi:hypothetical protein
MKPFTAMIPLLCIGLCALLVSCSEGGGSIYATIEVEKEVADSSLSNILTINDIVKTATANEYYVAAGGIFHGTLDTSADSIAWTPNELDATRPYNVSGGLCNVLAYYDGTLYGGFISTTGNLGLYKAASQADGTYSFITSSAEAVTGADKQVTLLRSLHGHLFMVCASVPSGGSSYVYEVDYLSTSTSSWTALKTGITSKILNIVYDGANYWMVTSSGVYKDATDPPSFAADSTATLGTYTVSGINDIFADSTNGCLFIPTKTGGVYYSVDRGSTWTNVTKTISSSSTTVPSFLTVAGPVDTAADMYLVGSDGYAYYTLSLSGAAMTRYSDSTVALYLESVRTILVDGTTVFMGTNTDGLWRTTFDASTGAIASDASWTHE